MGDASLLFARNHDRSNGMTEKSEPRYGSRVGDAVLLSLECRSDGQREVIGDGGRPQRSERSNRVVTVGDTIQKAILGQAA